MIDVRMQYEILLETEDRVGVLAEVSRLLADMGISLLSVVVRTNGETATLQLVTTSQTHAFEALQDACFDVDRRDVILMEIPHHTGFLSRVIEALARKEIAVEELYATVPESAATGVVVLRTSDDVNAVRVLRGR
jgi:hypothetical protein